MDAEEGDKIAVTLASGDESEIQIFKSRTGQLIQYLPIRCPTSLYHQDAHISKNPLGLAVSENRWVSSRGENLIRLPAEYRHISWKVQDYILGISLRLGRVIFFDFSPTATCSPNIDAAGSIFADDNLSVGSLADPSSSKFCRPRISHAGGDLPKPGPTNPGLATPRRTTSPPTESCIAM
ncbi:hypothetical protein BJY00DRAFT_282764 [Aspergillus carlsbadensis]|nr:hypothetical protein BJY00DRAFT_282764 [Aspergillus carlsbadensis]